MGEWSAKYGSSATRTKVYVGYVTNWFAKLNVVEIQVDATDLHRGDDLLFIGHKTGLLEARADDLRVDYEPASVARQGIRCSLALSAEILPDDLANPGERIHPRRNDKVYIWK